MKLETPEKTLEQRLEEIKEKADKAYASFDANMKKAKELCAVALKELTRPMSQDEKREDEEGVL